LTKKADSEKEKHEHSELTDSETLSQTAPQNMKNPVQIEGLEVDSLKRDLAEEKEKADKYLDNWRRMQADFDNYRKRTEKERSEISLNTTCDMVTGLLEVIDDLERALSYVPPDSEKLAWVEGVKLTHRKLLNTLEKLGMEEVCALGKVFDPNIHEAIAHTEGEEGTIMGEVQKGYKLRGKLLRPSRVVVGKGTENVGNNTD
jgi:molecular chaperone GrpE